MKIDSTKSQQIANNQIKRQAPEENKGPSDSVSIGGRVDDLNIIAPPMKDVKYAHTSSHDILSKEDYDPNSSTYKFMFDTGGHSNIRDLELKGTFNPETGKFDPKWNQGKGIKMYDDGTHGDKKAGDGIYSVAVNLDRASPEKKFAWGVTGDIYDKKGKKVIDDKWLMAENNPRTFDVDGPFTKQVYRLTTHHIMGVHKMGEDGISFLTWSPEVGKDELKDYKVYVDIFDKNGKPLYSTPMMKDPITGNWNLQKDTGWKELQGLGYRYSVKDKDGKPLLKGKTPVTYSDPYSRFLQGQQRGLERIFVDPVLGIETGWYDDSGKGGCNYADNPQWGRFTVDNRPEAEKVQLVLMDEEGKQLTKKELLDRLGEPKLLKYDEASPEDKKDVDTLLKWGVDTDGKVTDYKWTDGLKEDGTIDMKKIGDAWVSTVNNFDKLKGLKYEFRVYEDGKLVGDKDGDGKLSEMERRNTPFNDPFNNIISDRPGAERLTLIKESNYKFRYSNTPRKNEDPRKNVIYEAHVGSFMGSKDNANPSNFKDMIANLDYIENLGANTIELMPTNEFGGKRDWGYTPDYYFAGAEAYGFEMSVKEALERGVITPEEAKDKESVWVHGTDAIKVFVDEAHRRGFNVFADVVYNHVSGKADADNPLNMIDGDKNSFFKWWGKYCSDSPWGAKPAYSADEVKQFFTNNAVQQIDELGYDGIRFDFTQVLHDTGSTGEKWEGMQTLRKINKTIDNVSPGAITIAEDFTNNWLVAADYDKSEWQGEGDWRMEKQGMGFDGVWNDRFHDDLIGVLEGSASMDRLMEAITGHIGVANSGNAVIYAHSHDEVGNSGQWAARVAAHSQNDKDVEKPYPRAVARTAAAITLTGAGIPMIFQGEEFLDNADYKHGITSTWGNDIQWLNFDMNPAKLSDIKKAADNPAHLHSLSNEEKNFVQKYIKMTPEQKAEVEVLANKRGHFNWYKDLIALRSKSDAFSSTAELKRIFTHNADRVMAYERKSGNDDYIVVTNFNDKVWNDYKVGLPPGKWQEVLNSDSKMYGGDNAGNGGSIIDSSSGITIPRGGTVIFKRVG
ncbi:MAG TPA: alpha amylase C-terminal domain-containing protein [Candidatus Eremiobacteraeota bacterium]|nr:alpha amylase C-terminal domain-containing protein [Candidatus Eremiobacteraeota bacterium]